VLVSRHAGLATRVDRIAFHPPPQTALADPQITSGPRDRLASGNQIKGTTPELRRVSSRHYTDSFRGDDLLISDVRESGSGPQVVTNWMKALEQLTLVYPERINRYL
jgi:hypothetical protein